MATAGAPSSSAATPPPPHPPPPPTPPAAAEPLQQYWCHKCNKRVQIETLPDQPDLICSECKNGFIEVINHNHHDDVIDDVTDPLAFGNEFLQVLRLIAMAARDDDAPPPPPEERHVDDPDHVRIELNDDVAEDEDEDDDVEDEDEDDDVEEVRRRERRDVIRLRLREFASRALSPRNRMLDWAEILMGLEDHSIEFQFNNNGLNGGYIGNPGDYVDAAGYEELLQTLAETDSNRGAPPASKSAIEALVVVYKEKVKESELSETCAICKDKVFNNDKEVVKELPCGHMYHEECIVPWLGSRNTCPVCRYELETDDAEYEEERKKRLGTGTGTGTSSSGEE